MIENKFKSFDGKELPVEDICASFQECVSSTLVKKVKKALEQSGYKQVAIAGGVAAAAAVAGVIAAVFIKKKRS